MNDEQKKSAWRLPFIVHQRKALIDSFLLFIIHRS